MRESKSRRREGIVALKWVLGILLIAFTYDSWRDANREAIYGADIGESFAESFIAKILIVVIPLVLWGFCIWLGVRVA